MRRKLRSLVRLKPTSTLIIQSFFLDPRKLSSKSSSPRMSSSSGKGGSKIRSPKARKNSAASSKDSVRSFIFAFVSLFSFHASFPLLLLSFHPTYIHFFLPFFLSASPRPSLNVDISYFPSVLQPRRNLSNDDAALESWLDDHIRGGVGNQKDGEKTPSQRATKPDERKEDNGKRDSSGAAGE